MSCFSLSGIENKLLTQQYYDDIKCFSILNHYQRKHVIKCRCGRFPHVLGSTTAGIKPFKYYWSSYCIFCLECEKAYNTALNITGQGSTILE